MTATPWEAKQKNRFGFYLVVKFRLIYIKMFSYLFVLLHLYEYILLKMYHVLFGDIINRLKLVDQMFQWEKKS